MMSWMTRTRAELLSVQRQSDEDDVDRDTAAESGSQSEFEILLSRQLVDAELTTAERVVNRAVVRHHRRAYVCKSEYCMN
jgi:hypothetical protein